MNGDVIISSRVRLARNLAEYPFPNRTSPAQKNEICDKIRDIFRENKSFGIAHYSKMSETERISLVEKHFISREFAARSEGRELITADTVTVMVNEEDTLRIQSIVPGFDIDRAFKNADLTDTLIDENVKYAFDEQLGYLTACPTNLGCAMRASVMLHLPALVQTGQLNSLANSMSGLGFTIRGMYGEGSKAKGSIYQISNMHSEGRSETEIIENLKKIIVRIVDSELKARKTICEKSPIQAEDKILRSAAIAKSAKLMSEEEYFNILSDIAIGLTCGIIKDTTPSALYSTLNTLLTATIMAENRDVTDGLTRRMHRAEHMKKIFDGVM
ncbi:MAG: ATP--guanido phosphotransferase [Ruminococcaceae bacterium]|nr:ATP--guanido phosphotransferase [Oscillospiraceae bacterium]